MIQDLLLFLSEYSSSNSSESHHLIVAEVKCIFTFIDWSNFILKKSHQVCFCWNIIFLVFCIFPLLYVLTISPCIILSLCNVLNFLPGVLFYCRDLRWEDNGDVDYSRPSSLLSAVLPKYLRPEQYWKTLRSWFKRALRSLLWRLSFLWPHSCLLHNSYPYPSKWNLLARMLEGSICFYRCRLVTCWELKH